MGVFVLLLNILYATDWPIRCAPLIICDRLAYSFTVNSKLQMGLFVLLLFRRNKTVAGIYLETFD